MPFGYVKCSCKVATGPNFLVLFCAEQKTNNAEHFSSGHRTEAVDEMSPTCVDRWFEVSQNCI